MEALPSTDNLSPSCFEPPIVQKLLGTDEWRWQFFGECRALAFSPDGSFLAWSRGHEVFLVSWKALVPTQHSYEPDIKQHNDNCSRTFRCGEEVWSLGFGCVKSKERGWLKGHHRLLNLHKHPDDFLLAVGLGNGRIKLFSVLTGRLCLELWDHSRSVLCVSLGFPILLSASADATLKLWDLDDDGNMFKTLKTHRSDSCVTACTWAPDCQRFATGGTDKRVILYGREGYQVLRILLGHVNTVSCVRFSPDGALLASASFDTSVCLWSAGSGDLMAQYWHMQPPPRPIFANGPNNHFVRCVRFSRDGGHIATLCEDGQLRVWRLDEPSQPQMTTPLANGQKCDFAPDNCHIAICTSSAKILICLSAVGVSRLSDLCRLSLRQRLLDEDVVGQLPLPDKLKSFLLYQELKADFKEELVA